MARNLKKGIKAKSSCQEYRGNRGNFVWSCLLFEEDLHTICQHYTIDKVQCISLSHDTVEILSDIIFWLHLALGSNQSWKISGANVYS